MYFVTSICVPTYNKLSYRTSMLVKFMVGCYLDYKYDGPSAWICIKASKLPDG